MQQSERISFVKNLESLYTTLELVRYQIKNFKKNKGHHNIKESIGMGKEENGVFN